MCEDINFNVIMRLEQRTFVNDLNPQFLLPFLIITRLNYLQNILNVKLKVFTLIITIIVFIRQIYVGRLQN